MLAQKVAAGDIREPSSVIVPPADPKKAAHIDSWKPYRVPTVGFTPEKVAEFYQTQQPGQTAIERANELDGASAEAEGSDVEGADAEGSQKDKQPWYKEWQWRTFVNLQRSMPGAWLMILRSSAEVCMVGVSCDKVCAVAKEIMPTIFRPNLFRKTASKWKKKVELVEEREKEEREEEAAAPPEALLTAAEKDKKRRRNHDAIPVADKQQDFQQQIGKDTNRRILPASLLVGLASLLWVISQSGVPMNSSVALPLMVGHIREAGYGHLLHSKQSLVPIETLKSLGLPAEKGRLFMSKSFVNSFCSRIHLKTRRGTGNFAKSKRPVEVDSARLMMYYRMLYLTVTHGIKANRVFNFDETGVQLLDFGDVGRAQAGQRSEGDQVARFGRQSTIHIICYCGCSWQNDFTNASW